MVTGSTSVVAWEWRGKEGKDGGIRRYEETLGDDGYVHYLDWEVSR